MTLIDIIEQQELRFILFGGKGGVGKTSCAAAASIWAADQGKKTLVISTDPAHSLSDSLQQDMSGGDIKAVQDVANLYALEINAEKSMKTYQDSMNQAVEESGQAESNPIMGLMQGAGSMAYPGMDETLAFSKVLEFMNNDEYDVIIFDTAPTGHTLRLLSLPDIMNGFLGRIIKLQYSMKNMLGGFRRLLGKTSEQDRSLEVMEQQKQAIEEAKIVLADNTQTTFVPVLIPEAMAISETERLLTSLQEYEIPVSNLIINQLVPSDDLCEFCSTRRSMQQRHLVELQEVYGPDFILTEVELFKDEITGLSMLRQLGDVLFNADNP